eukprot:764666-Hanusia_phi.AAC.1
MNGGRRGEQRTLALSHTLGQGRQAIEESEAGLQTWSILPLFRDIVQGTRSHGPHRTHSSPSRSYRVETLQDTLSGDHSGQATSRTEHISELIQAEVCCHFQSKSVIMVRTEHDTTNFNVFMIGTDFLWFGGQAHQEPTCST